MAHNLPNHQPEASPYLFQNFLMSSIKLHYCGSEGILIGVSKLTASDCMASIRREKKLSNPNQQVWLKIILYYLQYSNFK